MKTGTIVILDEMKRVPYVDITEEGRKAYFKGRYEKFMQLTGQLTLEDFSSDAGKALELRILINNSCCDAVTNEINRFDGFDDFMRTASGRYYIGNIFYMLYNKRLYRKWIYRSYSRPYSYTCFTLCYI